MFIRFTERTFEQLKPPVIRHIEKRGGVRISVDEKELSASVESAGEEGVGEYICSQVLEAIALGFPVRKAYKLFYDDHYLEVLDFGHSDKPGEVQAGRIIGREGKSRKTLEELSNAFISVEGNRVAFLGDYESIQIARKAVEKILMGSSHKGVYRQLEHSRKRV